MKKELNREHKIKSTQKMNKWRKIENKKKATRHRSRVVPRPGTNEPPPVAPAFGRVTHHWSRFVSEPGLMTSVISPDALVSGREPGLMAMMNRD